MRWCTYLLTYLHSWLGAYKTVEYITVEYIVRSREKLGIYVGYLKSTRLYLVP